MDETDTFAKRLRAARLKRGFKTGVEACRHFGWNVASYQQHENGTRRPRDPQKIEYARQFNVSVGWLIEGRGALALQHLQGRNADSSSRVDDQSDLTVLGLLAEIQSDLSAFRAEFVERLARVENIITKQRRDTAGLLVMAKAVTGGFAEQVAAIEERVRVLEARGR